MDKRSPYKFNRRAVLEQACTAGWFALCATALGAQTAYAPTWPTDLAPDLEAQRVAKERRQLVNQAISKNKIALQEGIGIFTAEEVRTVSAASGRLHILFGPEDNPIGEAIATGWRIQEPQSASTPNRAKTLSAHNRVYVATADHALTLKGQCNPDQISSIWLQQEPTPTYRTNLFAYVPSITACVPEVYKADDTRDQGLLRIEVPEGFSMPSGLAYDSSFTFSHDNEQLLVVAFPEEVPATGQPPYISIITANTFTYNNEVICKGLSDVGSSGAAVVAKRNGKLCAVALVSKQINHDSSIVLADGLQDMDMMFHMLSHE
jgi:hypothetical protein